MSGEEFRFGTLMHGLCLMLVALLVAIYGWWAGRQRSRSERARHRLDLVIAWGCLLAWLVNTLFWMWPSRFRWEQALPLHYCNMANLIGALAVFTRRRFFQALLYFWALALCVWAFITPTVRMGYLYGEFWIFWFYHLFIVLAVAHVLIVDRFRPAVADLPALMGFTALYTAMLVAVDNVWGWNYGFVGPSEPESVTLIDALGPYPLRLVWIALLAVILFLLCLLPWVRRRPR